MLIGEGGAYAPADPPLPAFTGAGTGTEPPACQHAISQIDDAPQKLCM